MVFSVIVPIYNVEKYLNKCIDSVLCQTFSDFELVLVDDGSPDGCGKICDDYAAKDKRVKVVHKENGGLVSARQAGIRVAEGDFVFHLDGDDAITPDALESAHKIISETNADIVSFGLRRCVNGKIGEPEQNCVAEGFYNKEEMVEKLYPKLLCDENMKHIFYFLCGKAIRREIVTKHQLNVDQSISLGEDLSCGIPCFMESKSAYMSSKAVYLYTIRDDSMTTVFKTDQITKIANVIKGLRKLEIKMPQDFEEQISRYSCYMCFAVLAAAAEGKHFDSIVPLTELISSTINKDEIQKARFGKITPKSRIAVFLMKKQKIKSAFYFLYFCKLIKNIRKSDEND